MPDRFPEAGGPSVATLDSYRFTKAFKLDGGILLEQVDDVDFTNPLAFKQALSEPWKGFIIFHTIDSDDLHDKDKDFKDQDQVDEENLEDFKEHECLEMVSPSQLAKKPKALPSPSEPSKHERELHNLTHLPYRTWVSLVCFSKREAVAAP